MVARTWLIAGMGALVTAGSVAAAVLFGLRGLEVASWVAAVASVTIGIAAIVLAAPAVRRPHAPAMPGTKSIHSGGDISGIASTGDNSVNFQQR